MFRRTVIRSGDNLLLKRARAVLAGREDGWIALEGERLVGEARAAGLDFELVLVAESRESLAGELESQGLPVRRVAEALLERASALATSPGVLAVCAAPRPPRLEDLPLAADALVLVAAGVSDPGNLGAVARSAEAAGAQAIVLVEGGVGPWNEKALRGSMGSLLRLPVCAFPDAAQAAAALERLSFRHVQAAARGGQAPASSDWSGRVALWIGSETGAFPAQAARFERVTIPMRGRVESLNVAVAAALLLYAAGRADARGRGSRA